MVDPQVQAKPALYDIDYQLWLDHTVAQLKARDFGSLDLANLIEEVESLGKSDKRAIASYLMRLCEHLLKLTHWETERERCFRAWKLEIANFRIQIQAILADSPSLKTYLRDNFGLAYSNGRKLFLKGSDLDPTTVPETPSFSLDQALNEDWLPWQPTNPLA